MELFYTPTALKRLKTIGAKDQKKIKRKIVAWPLRIIYSFNPESQQIVIEVVDYRGGVYKK